MIKLFVGPPNRVEDDVFRWLAGNDFVVVGRDLTSKKVNGELVVVLALEYRFSDRLMAKKIMEERL